MNIRYVEIIPASDIVQTGQPLNLLCLMENLSDGMQNHCVKLWARAEGNWVNLLTKEAELQPKEHKHLYITVPKECTTAAWWGQWDLEELELILSDEIPTEDSIAKMIFVAE